MKKILGNLISIIIACFLMVFGGMIFDKFGIKFQSLFGALYIIIIIIPGYYFSKEIILKFFSVIQIKEFENGDKYEGEMKNGKMQGKGIYTFSNGEIYEGEFKDNMFHGKGKYTWTDGKVESGTWENDDRIDKKK
jgi:hypothetical protein